MVGAAAYVATLRGGNLGVKLDFQERTITIDKILLPMRNITNLQLKPIGLPGHSEKIPVLLKSQLAHAALPGTW